MQDASNAHSGTLLDRLERAQELLAEAIALARSGPREVKAKKTRSHGRAIGHVDFTSNFRAFVKRYAGGMSGARKFVLLIAYLTRGDTGKRVSLEEIQRHWNRMTAKGLLGGKFNRFFTAAAKEHDWVTTEKSGLYYLRPTWREIFQ
ncbi:MAG: hypothetical protein WA624_20565 [Methylocella sp.]